MIITSVSESGSLPNVAGPPGVMALAIPVPYTNGINAAALPPATTVVYLGSLYMCIEAHVTGSFIPSKWQVLAEKGDTGPVVTVNGVSPDTEGELTLSVTDIPDAAPLASPALTGTPTSTTPDVSDDTTRVATTAFVQDVAATLQALSAKGQPSGYASLDGSGLVPAAQLPPGSITSGRNIVVNGRFQVDQMRVGVEATVTDNGVACDRWRYLGEASCAFTSRVLGSDGLRTCKVKFTGTTDKGGIWQTVESADCIHLRNQPVIMQAKIAVNNARLGNMKIGIAEFTGTANQTTGDPISSWGASGTTPTLAANWAWITTPANLNATTVEAVYSAQATVGATMTNLAVVIWNDDKTYSANDYFTVGSVQLEVGSSYTPFEVLPFGEVLRRCQRFMCKTYDHLTALADATFNGALRSMRNAETTAGGHVMNFRFPVPMFGTPTITAYSPGSGSAGYMRREDDGTEVTAASGSVGENGCYIANNAAATAGYSYYVHGLALSNQI